MNVYEKYSDEILDLVLVIVCYQCFPDWYFHYCYYYILLLLLVLVVVVKVAAVLIAFGK